MVQKNPFLTFDPLTLVPIQKKLIDASLLNDKEVGSRCTKVAPKSALKNLSEVREVK